MMKMRIGSRSSASVLSRFACVKGSRVVAAAAALTSQRRTFVETNTDPQYWRTPEKNEIKRKHPGIPLGSQFARIKEQGEKEQELVQRDQFTNWSLIYRYAAAVVVLLLGLNGLLIYGEPPKSPEYTPYVKPREEGSGKQ